jgi:hypothetical protein
MATMATAVLQVRVNNGSPQIGGIVANASDEIQLVAQSYAGWGTPAPRWEILAYPPGWATPIGWTLEASSGIIYYLGTTPPSFTLPDAAGVTAGMFGVWRFGLTVNGGSRADLIDNGRTAVEIISDNGVRDTAYKERTEFDPKFAFASKSAANNRLLDQSVGAMLAKGVGTPETVKSTVGSAGVLDTVAPFDHSHQLTEAVFREVAGSLAAPLEVTGQTVVSAGFVAPHFVTNDAGAATAGLLRGKHGTVIVASRDFDNFDNVPLISYGTDANNVLTIGDSIIPCMEFVIASGCAFEFYHDTQLLYTLAQNAFSIGPTHNFLIMQADGVGAGNDAVIQAQSGAAGNTGGKLVLRAGAPGAGANASGIDLDLDDGPTASGLLSVKAGAFGSILNLSYNNASFLTTLTLGPSNARIEANTTAFNFVNVVLFNSAGNFGDGNKVLFISNTGTEPFNDITDGIGICAFGSALKTRNRASTVLAPEVEDALGNEDLRTPDRRAKRTTTIGATPTNGYTYAMPDNSVAFFDVEVVAFTPADGTSAVFNIRAGVKRFGGGIATLIGGLDVLARTDDPSIDATLDVDGNNARVRITGVGTVEWLVTPNVTLLG